MPKVPGDWMKLEGERRPNGSRAEGRREVGCGLRENHGPPSHLESSPILLLLKKSYYGSFPPLLCPQTAVAFKSSILPTAAAAGPEEKLKDGSAGFLSGKEPSLQHSFYPTREGQWEIYLIRSPCALGPAGEAKISSPR